MTLQEGVARNLRVMLAERQIKKTDLADLSGISRNTLTSLTSDKTKMIQFETIEKISEALDVEPYELFKQKKTDKQARKSAD